MPKKQTTGEEGKGKAGASSFLSSLPILKKLARRECQALEEPLADREALEQKASQDAFTEAGERVETGIGIGKSPQTVIEMGPAVAFILKLATALHDFGTPAHRLEAALTIAARRLGLKIHAFAVPTSLMIAFDKGEDQRVFMIRTTPGDVQLEKLGLLDDVAKEVIRGRLSPAAGTLALDSILAQPPRYGRGLIVLAFGLVAASTSRFFGGGIAELAIAFPLGLMIGLLAVLGGRIQTVQRLMPALAALITTLCAQAFSYWIAPISVFKVVIPSMIILLPGLSLTVAMTELATQHLVSGVARFSAAMMVFAQLGFGVALGGHVGHLLFQVDPFLNGPSLPDWTIWPALVVACCANAVLCLSDPRDWKLWLVSGALSFFGARLGADLLGPSLGGFLAAFSLAAAGNLFARIYDRPSTLFTVPGLLPLVPGSMGFRSVTALLEKDIVNGLETAFFMLMVSASLVAGLLIAQMVIPPRKTL